MHTMLSRGRAFAALLSFSAVFANAHAADAGHAYGRYQHERDRGCAAPGPVYCATPAPVYCAAPAPVYCASPAPVYYEPQERVYVPVVAPPCGPPSSCSLSISGVTISFGGYVGGLAIAGSYQRPLGPGYVYLDPYCGERFASLDDYARHSRRHHHPARVKVIRYRSPVPESYSSWERHGEDGGRR